MVFHFHRISKFFAKLYVRETLLCVSDFIHCFEKAPFFQIPNLVRFSFVWIVFMAAFGVISKAVSTPQRFGDVTAYDIINVISLSYWQTYGELFLDDLDADMDLKANISG